MDTELRARVHHALGEPHRLTMVDALALSDRAPSELAVLTGLPSNLVAFHLDVLEDAGVVGRRTSQGDGRRRYVHLRPAVLAGLTAGADLTATSVLFVCTANSARSQLAAALWEDRTGRAAASAGHRPAARIHPLAVDVAARHGLDLGDRTPRGYDEVTHQPDLVVAVCDLAHEAGPPFDAPVLHWSIADPVGGDRGAFDAAFVELCDRVDHLAARTEVAA
jgi:ArsR family transcriptional regulator, arsenate/arsenite/antimonite-responsive transcriptional repressor / arsenate reductase (thioredoxin)